MDWRAPRLLVASDVIKPKCHRQCQQLTLIIGRYAQCRYIGLRRKSMLTETVRAWDIVSRKLWLCHIRSSQRKFSCGGENGEWSPLFNRNKQDDRIKLCF
jgi:hypothetical protein